MNQTANTKVELYIDKLDHESNDIKLLDEHQERISMIHKVLENYERVYESLLSEIFVAEKSKLNLLNRSIDGMRSLYKMELAETMKELDDAVNSKNEYMVYAKQAKKEIAEIRSKLQVYLNSGVTSNDNSDSKKKLVEILISSKGGDEFEVRKAEIRKSPIKEVVQEQENTQTKEEDEKFSSPLGKTLKALYQNMQQQQAVFLKNF